MKALIAARQQARLSQRALAQKAGIAFGSVQALERAEHNPSLDTLEKVADALQLEGGNFLRQVEDYFRQLPDSLALTSYRIVAAREKTWKIHFFNFVDAFRRKPAEGLIVEAPSSLLSSRLRALLASTVEQLCDDQEMPWPWWTCGILALAQPWFVSETENLKAISVVESAIHFRKRNIFVLANFLDRV